MPIIEREDEILKLLSKNNTLSIKIISKKLFISEPTVRRDLIKLAAKGLVIRTHGGVILNSMSADKRIPLYLRETEMSDKKKLIAKKALSLIKDGDVIMLDASTTAFHIIPYLSSFKDIIVITSSAKAVLTLNELNIRTFCTGGEIINESFSYVGQDAINMVKRYNADILFFSCRGLSSDGILNDNSLNENILRKSMMLQSKKSVLLIDSSKFNIKDWNNLCSLNEIDYCFSDIELPEYFKAMLRSEQNK